MLSDEEKQSQRDYVADTVCWLYPKIISVLPEISRKTGYCFGVHGSQKRDLDIVAVAWTDECLDVEAMLRVLCERIGRFTRPCQPVHSVEIKPHGRLAYTITLNYGCWIDLSVIAPRGREPVSRKPIDCSDWHKGIGGPSDSN